MTLFQAIGTGFRKYADFTGTASRSEFWWWALFATLAGTTATAISNAAFSPSDVNGLWSLLLLIPSLAVTVRRLRDAGYGWGHALWVLIPVAGVIIVAVLASQPPASGIPAHPPGGDATIAVH